MVKSYNRFEQAELFALISSNSTIVHVKKDVGLGHAFVGACDRVYEWVLKTGELVRTFSDSSIHPRTKAVTLAHDPSSDILAVGYSDGTIRVWDVQTATVMITFTGHKNTITTLKFDPSATRLVSGSYDTNIILWDLVAEVGVCRLRGHKGNITSLNFVNENWLLSTSKDGILKLWDLQTQFCVETHVASTGECWSAYLQDGNKLYTGFNSTEIKVWEIDMQKEDGHKVYGLGALDKQSKQRTIELTHSDKFLFSTSIDTIQLWRLRNEEELKSFVRRQKKRQKKKLAEGEEPTIELTPKDFYLQHGIIRPKAKILSMAIIENQEKLILNLANNSVEVWDFSTPDEAEKQLAIDLPGHRTDVRDISISQDGKLLVSGSNGLIKLYNTKSTKCIRTIDGTGYVLSLKFLPGDALVVVGTKEGNIDLYDVVSSTKLGSYPAHEGGVWSLDISADGSTIASGGADKSAKFWELKIVQEEVAGNPGLYVDKMTLKNSTKLEFSDDVLAVKFSPDFRFFAASLLDNTIKVYYRDTLKFFLNLYGHQLPVLSIDISHDSKLLISSSADKNIKIWGLDFGDCHKSIFAHDDSILRVCFEPHTYNFFSCSKDGFLKYWDAKNFQQIQKLEGHQSEVWALCASPDGSYVASASHDHSIRIWEQTDEPLFIQEERENEMEQNYEEGMIESLEQDLQQQRQQGVEEVEELEGVSEQVAHHSLDSLKAGERLFEALEICITDMEEKPNPRNIILASLNVEPEKYLFDILSKIKPNLVEDALLTFSLEQFPGLFKFILIWLQKGWNIPLVCRVLFFCLRNFHRQIVANRMMQADLEDIKYVLREKLQKQTDIIGTNLAHAKLIKSQWDLEHIHTLEDAEPDAGKKRAFSTIA